MAGARQSGTEVPIASPEVSPPREGRRLSAAVRDKRGAATGGPRGGPPIDAGEVEAEPVRAAGEGDRPCSRARIRTPAAGVVGAFAETPLWHGLERSSGHAAPARWPVPAPGRASVPQLDRPGVPTPSRTRLRRGEMETERAATHESRHCRGYSGGGSGAVAEGSPSFRSPTLPEDGTRLRAARRRRLDRARVRGRPRSER
jgi:hypothetical protein